jgi:hypothetical protein
MVRSSPQEAMMSRFPSPPHRHGGHPADMANQRTADRFAGHTSTIEEICSSTRTEKPCLFYLP